MNWWLILVTLPALIFWTLCWIFATSIWTRFMKNLITQNIAEPNANEAISDVNTRNEVGNIDSCNSIIITDRTQSEVFNQPSVPNEKNKNELASDDKFYSKPSMNKHNVNTISFGDDTKETKTEDPICISTRDALTITPNVIVISTATMTVDKITVEESGYKIADEESGDIIADSGDNIAVEEPGDKIADSRDKIDDEKSGDKITDGEFGDKIAGGAARDKIAGGAARDKIAYAESGDKIADGESGDKIVDGESGDKIADNGESNNKIADHEDYIFISSVMDGQCNFVEKYFGDKINEILEDKNHSTSNLDIPEDKLTPKMCNEFHISTTIEKTHPECDFSYEDNAPIIADEKSVNCVPNELKNDAFEMDDYYKCSLDIIPMEFTLLTHVYLTFT